MDVIPYGGWARCAHLKSGDLEALVTLEVGPRVIRFGRPGGPNLLAEYPDHSGRTGEATYRSYGGHRLWVAPEEPSVTYEPDNDPVEVAERDNFLWFAKAAGPLGLRREIGLSLCEGRALALRHRIVNQSVAPRLLAPWCVTVMAPGGECAFPQAPYRPHPEALLPARALVLWPYTRMGDPRWTWGDRAIRLRQREEGLPQKAGASVEQGLAVYANAGELFVKRFPFDSDAVYPDLGCNFEVFTRWNMLEIESLGPLVHLAPGTAVEHRETWYLLPGSALPDDDDALGDLLDGVAESCPLL
jgi:hypothetical protein